MTNKLSPLQEWIDQWTAVPGAEDMDIEAAHRLGCFDGAMWLLEQLESYGEFCRKATSPDELLYGSGCWDAISFARELCGKQEVEK